MMNSTVVRNFEECGWRVGREVVRCCYCQLVQYWEQPAICRRCRLRFRTVTREDEPPPRQEPMPVYVSAGYDIGAAIKFWREVLKLSQHDMEKRGISRRQHVSRVENHHLRPGLSTCEHYAKVLGISVRVLILTAEGLAREPS